MRRKRAIKNDIASIEGVARRSGMGMAADIDNQIMKKLPEEFRQLGMRTHRGLMDSRSV
jgi:hypothetical protein